MEELQETQTAATVKGGTSKRTKFLIGAGVIVGIVVLILLCILLLNNPTTTETVRDLFIILLALETFIIGALLAILIFQLIALVRMLRSDLKPIIESTQETVHTVKGTASFVSDRVARPAVTIVSYATGIRRSLEVLAQMLPRRRRE